MSISAIIMMIICLGGIIGGFIFFLSKAIKLDAKNKEKENPEIEE